MNQEEYLKKSKETLTGTTEEQREIDLNMIRDLVQCIHMSNIADSIKRQVYYGDKNWIDRFNKEHDNIQKTAMKLPTGYESDPTALVVPDGRMMNLLHAAIGKYTEAGEMLLEVLDAIIEGRDVDRVNMKEEVGDGTWYDAIICRECDFTFEDVFEANINKLNNKRFKGGFTKEKAVNRDLDGERKVLEG